MKSYNYIIDGEFKSFTNPILGQTEIGDLPLDVMRWPKVSGGKVVLDEAAKSETLKQELQSKKLYYQNLMKQKEKEDIEKGFEYNGFEFDSDEKAQNFISAILTAVNSGLIDSISYTTKNNEDIELSKSDIKGLAAACITHVAFCHAEKREKYKLIEACKSIEELEAL